MSSGGSLVLREYSDYRSYLRDWFESRKALRPGFSYRRFSALLGLKSPNFMQLVISGQRGVSAEVANRLCRVMGLRGAERTYFLALVEHDGFAGACAGGAHTRGAEAGGSAGSAAGEAEREAAKALLIARRRLVTSHLERVKEIIVSEWYHMLVRELVCLPSFEPTGAYVSRALNGLISEEEAANSLKLLMEVGLFIRGEDGRWQTRDAALDTGNFVFARSTYERAHAGTLKAWASALDRLNPSEQELGLLHVPIASEKIPELRERIRRFQDELIGWLCEEKNPDRVVQVGTYLIPFDKI